MTHYYLKDGKLFEIDQMPPEKHAVGHHDKCLCDVCLRDIAISKAFVAYLSTLQPIEQEGLTGEGIKVLGVDFKWEYRNIPVHESGAVARGLMMVAVPICKTCKGTGWDMQETATTIAPIACPQCTTQPPAPPTIKGREGEKMSLISLSDLEPGSLFEYKKTVALKTEYKTEDGAIEAFILGSGEMFWGGTNQPSEQRNLMVKPVPYVCAGDLQKIKHNLEITGMQLYTAIEFICSRNNTAPNEPGRKRHGKRRY